MKIKHKIILFLSVLLISVSRISATTYDVTGLITGPYSTHECIFQSKYDTTKHWKECILCGKTQNTANHSMAIVGTPGCSSGLGYQYKRCSCGYSIQLPKVAHTSNGTWIAATDRNGHYQYCTVCGPWTKYETCNDTWGRAIGCTGVSGTCVKCGQYRASNQHSHYTTVNTSQTLSGRTYSYSGYMDCTQCGTKIGTFTASSTQLTSNRSRLVVNFNFNSNVTTNISSVSFGNCSGIASLGNVFQTEYLSNPTTNSYSTSGIVTYYKNTLAPGTWEIHMATPWQIQINGYSNWLHAGFNFRADWDAPTYTASNIVYSKFINGFATKATLTASYNESYDDICYIRLLDSDQKTVISDWGSAVQNGTTFTRKIDITDEINGSKNIYLQAKDRSGNTSALTSITISNLDSKIPTLINNIEISTGWSKYKNIKITTKDNGSGNVQVAFNKEDNSVFQYSDKNGSNYITTYKVIGDVYDKVTAAIYIKDMVGNITTKYVDIKLLDNTNPSLTAINKVNNNTSIKMTAIGHDKRNNVNGSGIAYYYYYFDNTTSGNIKNMLVEHENGSISNIDQRLIKSNNTISYARSNLNGNYIHIAAVDNVGNVGNTITEKIPGNSITYDLNGGTVTPKNPTEYWNIDNNFTLNKPERDGYYFIGWTGSNGSIPEREVTIDTTKGIDLTYKANWINKTALTTNLKISGTNIYIADELNFKYYIKTNTDGVLSFSGYTIDEKGKKVGVPHYAITENYIKIKENLLPVYEYKMNLPIEQITSNLSEIKLDTSYIKMKNPENKRDLNYEMNSSSIIEITEDNHVLNIYPQSIVNINNKILGSSIEYDKTNQIWLISDGLPPVSSINSDYSMDYIETRATDKQNDNNLGSGLNTSKTKIYIVPRNYVFNEETIADSGINVLESTIFQKYIIRSYFNDIETYKIQIKLNDEDIKQIFKNKKDIIMITTDNVGNTSYIREEAKIGIAITPSLINKTQTTGPAKYLSYKAGETGSIITEFSGYVTNARIEFPEEIYKNKSELKSNEFIVNVDEKLIFPFKIDKNQNFIPDWIPIKITAWDEETGNTEVEYVYLKVDGALKNEFITRIRSN